jgi:DNA repair protein RecN (Recombination protein N)
LDLDPSRLSAVEERLALLRRALSRFGPTEADFAQRLTLVCEELDTLGDDSVSPEALDQELAIRIEAVTKIGKRLVRARRRASHRFATAVATELGSLGMSSAELQVAMADEFDPATILTTATNHGPTPVDFVVRINPGEPATPMRETASGGEMARIVLAIKKTLADQDRVPFLVFDEVDAEIGGRLGFEVGAKLQHVANHHQVLIVTHLPQVAAFADAHFKVTKIVSNDRTLSGIERLNKKAVDHELAEMSVGDEVDAEALREARRMRKRATTRGEP